MREIMNNITELLSNSNSLILQLADSPNRSKQQMANISSVIMCEIVRINSFVCNENLSGGTLSQWNVFIPLWRLQERNSI